MTLIEKAIDLAIRAHRGQMRKYRPLPYIVHPLEVMSRVMELPGATEIEIAASVLHDIIEDCEQKYVDEIEKEFPREVFALVHQLTNPSKGLKLPRSDRKFLDRQALKQVSPWAKKIKMVDRICNLKDMKGHSKEFIELYCTESWLLLEVVKDADKELAEELTKAISFFN